MNTFKTNKISKTEFKKLNEDDLLFITNPGRMGDEDGTTFIIKNNNELTIYRIDGWMYPSRNEKDTISLEEFSKQFPKWREVWKKSKEKDFNEKYKYLYMGFGNGLSVDNSIYNIFEPYLNCLKEQELKESNDKESFKYSAIYNVWTKAFINMVNDKGYILK